MNIRRLLCILTPSDATARFRSALKFLIIPVLATGMATAALPGGNLLANPSGAEAPDVGWTIIAGTPVPDFTGWGRATSGGQDGTPGYFITSYSPNPCRRSQLIDLVARGATTDALDAAPRITAGEWINCYKAFSNTGQDKYYIKIELRAADGTTVLASQSAGNETAMLDTPLVWTENSFVFTNYGPGVRYIYFEDGGWDGGFWSGQYGSYHDAANVSFSQDTDNDGIPDAVEDNYPFLDKNDPTDADEDGDGDELSNLIEFNLGLDLGDPDTDNDNATDGEEAGGAIGTDPKKPDTDGDGLLDGDEYKTYHTNPFVTDSDGDFFSDKEEITAGTDPNDAASHPAGATIEILGIGTGFLVGGDITDPENDGAPDANTNYNFISIAATNKAFYTGEGAFNVFDNRVGGGNDKWYFNGLSAAAPQSVTVQFAAAKSIGAMTITSADDSPERDPIQWEIQGSNDGTTFSTIYRYDKPTSVFTNRQQVVKITFPAASAPFTYFRYVVFKTGGTEHQISEIELLESVSDGDNDGMPDSYEAQFPGVLNPAVNDASGDADGDGLSNLQEYQNKTSPIDADSDDDGVSDGAEFLAGADPLTPKVTAISKSGTTVSINVKFYDTTKNYKLRRSTTMLPGSYTDIGAQFKPTGTTMTLTDTTATGTVPKAIYIIETVP